MTAESSGRRDRAPCSNVPLAQSVWLGIRLRASGRSRKSCARRGHGSPTDQFCGIGQKRRVKSNPCNAHTQHRSSGVLHWIPKNGVNKVPCRSMVVGGWLGAELARSTSRRVKSACSKSSTGVNRSRLTAVGSPMLTTRPALMSFILRQTPKALTRTQTQNTPRRHQTQLINKPYANYAICVS